MLTHKLNQQLISIQGYLSVEEFYKIKQFLESGQIEGISLISAEVDPNSRLSLYESNLVVLENEILSENLLSKITQLIPNIDFDELQEKAIELVETGDKDRETLNNEARELLYEVADVSGSEEEQIFPLEYVRERRQKLDVLAVQLMDEIVVYVEKQSQSTESSETTPKPVYINIPSLFSLVKNETISVTNEIVSGFSEIGNEIVSGFSEIGNEIVSGFSKITNDLFPEYSYELVPIRSSDRSSDKSSDDIQEIAKIIELGEESPLLVITAKENKNDPDYPFELSFYLYSKKEKYFPDNIEMILYDHSEEISDKITSVKPNNSQSDSLCRKIKSQKGDKIELQIHLEDFVVREYFEI